MQIGLLPLATVVAFLLKTTGVLLLTIGAVTLLRRASAGTKHTVWLAALVLVLALPLLASTLPRWRVLPSTPALLGIAPESTPAAWVELASRSRVVVSGVRADATRERLTPAPGAAISSALPASDPAPSAAGGGSISSSISGLDAASALIVLWAVGALIILGRLAKSALALRRTLAEADPLQGSEWTTPLWEACDRLDLKNAPRLLRNEQVSMPFACGLVRPTIVLPATAEEWSIERRRAVLFHELAHIRRRDLLGHTLGRLACAFYWIHPLVWTAARHLRAESERACDDLVLSSGTPASEYADHLLQILVGVRGHDAPAVALPMGRRREFEGRMLAILDPALRRRDSRLAHGGALALLLVGAVVLVAMAPVEAGGGVPGARETVVLSADAEGSGDLVSTRGQAISFIESGNDASGSGSGGVPHPPEPADFAAPPEPLDALPHAPQRTHLGSEVTAAFGSLLEHTVEDFVSGGLSALFRSGAAQQKNIPLLIRLLASDESPEVRRTAAWALSGELNADASAALVRALREDANAEVREMAAWSLREVATPAADDAVLRSLEDDSSADVRGRAAWLLGHRGMRNDGWISALAAALADGSPDVRQRAAWAIGTIEPASAPPALYSRTLRDSDAEVRLTAAWALGQIADPQALSDLSVAFERESDPETLQAITRALLMLGPLEPRAIEKLLGSSDPEVRARAVRITAGVEMNFWPWPWPWPEPRPLP